MAIIFCLLALFTKNLLAIDCTIYSTKKYFTEKEVHQTLLDVTKSILKINNLLSIEVYGIQNKKCHFNVYITLLSSSLTVLINYNKQNYIGGSNLSSLKGLKEAIIRALYKSDYQEKICLYFGEAYNLNCFLYKQQI